MSYTINANSQAYKPVCCYWKGYIESKYPSRYAYKRQYYLKHKERYKMLSQAWIDSHREEYLERKRLYHKRTYVHKGRHGICNYHHTVKQYDLYTGELLATYKSITDAAYDNRINYKTIRHAVNNNNGVSPRLGWRWEIQEQHKGLMVLQYDIKTGQLLGCFSSFKDAASKLGISYNTIPCAIRKNNGLSPRLGWRWEVCRQGEVDGGHHYEE